MAVAKITDNRLEKEGKNYRAERIPGKNKYLEEVNKYDADNEDAKHHDDDQHPWGKGTGKSMGYAIRNLSASKTDIDYSNVDTTTEAGGSYDIYGTKGVDKAYQGDSGRKYLQRINIYGPENQYRKDSVDIDETVRGQYIN